MDDKDLFSYSEPEESKNESLDLNSFSSGAVDKVRQQKAKKQQGKKKIFRILLTLFLVFAIAMSGIVGVVVLWLSSFDASVDYDLSDLELNFTTTIYVTDKAGQWKEYQRLHGEFNRIWVSYHAELAQDQKDGKETAAQYTGIPKRLADAFVAVEDKRFYTHYGVDWRRTTGAIINTFIPIYSSKQGGSTITQQLIKNLTDDREQNASRKVREIMRARYIEKNYAKETILECYLNTIPMGHGIYGVEVAANYYFGKSVNELTLLECAALASITKAPSTYAPDDNPEKNKERRETVLSLMLDQKLITQEEHDAALQEEFKVVASRESLNESKVNNYFVDALIVDVTNDLAEKYGWDDAHAAENFYTGGYKIYATLDPDIQETVDEVFTNSEKYGLKGKDGQQLQGAFTIMDYNGRVRGMSGGIGKKEANLGLSGFNRATDAIRQPGSTMKPIAAYAPAIESGKIHYSSMLNDTAVNYNGWTPKNWYNSYWGNVTTQYALERSINTVPVALVNEMGPQSCYDFLTSNKKLNITTLNENDIALSPLGMGGTNGGITTIESAAAYQVFGNGGRYYEPTLYYAVYDQRNEQVLSNENMTPNVVISEDTATVMNKLLQTVVYGSNGTGRAAAGYIKNMKIYAKTGTSNNANDLWFVGGSPYYVASCWCGYDNQQSISDSGIAHKMWGAVMSKIHAELQPRDFDISSYATQRYYCTETGALATDACPSKSVGWYKSGKSFMPSVCGTHAGTVLGTPEEEAKKEEDAQKPEEGDNSSNAENSESTENTESTESTESTTPSEDSQTDENTENGENAE